MKVDPRAIRFFKKLNDLCHKEGVYLETDSLNLFKPRIRQMDYLYLNPDYDASIDTEETDGNDEHLIVTFSKRNKEHILRFKPKTKRIKKR